MERAWVAVLAAVLLAVMSVGCSSGTENATQSPSSTANPDSAGAAGSVWVADEGADSLTVLDAAANTVMTTLTGIAGPHNVQVDRAGTTVYASSTGSDRVVAIDAATYQVAAVAATGPHPAHVIEAPNGKVYVANSGDGTVSVFRADGLQPLGLIDVGGMPHGLRAAADGSVVVVANHATGALDVIDARTDRVLGAVPVGIGPAQVALTADGRYAFTGITAPPSVVKVDLNARKVVGSAAVSAPPVQVYLTPDDTAVLSADQGTPGVPGNAVSLIDTATMTVRATIRTGAGPHGVVIDGAGARAWVTNSYDNTVSVIDLAGRTVSATVPVGRAPNGISYSTRPPTPGAATIPLNLPGPPSAHHPDEHASAPPTTQSEHQSGHG